MATSQQKEQLVQDVKRVLGLSNVAFDKYNYKPTKAMLKVINIIVADLTHIDIKIMRDNSTDLLISLSIEGHYGKLTKPMIKALHSISATDWYPNKIEMFIGSHHAGFDGLIIAAEVIRFASRNGVALTRQVMDCLKAKRSIEESIIRGTPKALSGWNYHEKGYIFRQCGVSEVDLDAFANYEDKTVNLTVVEQCLVVDIVGIRNINSSFKLRFIDEEIVGFDFNKSDTKALSLFKAWLLVRGKNVKDLYQQVLFEQKRDALKQKIATGNETLEVVRQIVIASSQIACSTNGNFEELDKLAEQYLKLRKAN